MTRRIIARQEELGPFTAWRAWDDSLGADGPPLRWNEIRSADR